MSLKIEKKKMLDDAIKNFEEDLTHDEKNTLLHLIEFEDLETIRNIASVIIKAKHHQL
jgi:hypothetical protein